MPPAYRMAAPDEAEAACRVIQAAIRTVYPRYYRQEVVDFFLQHHSPEHVAAAVRAKNVFVLADGPLIAGTGAIHDNHVEGVYVLPELQGRGFGSELMDRLEEAAASRYATVVLEASLPAVRFYEHRGYRTLRHDSIDLEGGARLIFPVMEKALRRAD